MIPTLSPLPASFRTLYGSYFGSRRSYISIYKYELAICIQQASPSLSIQRQLPLSPPPLSFRGYFPIPYYCICVLENVGPYILSKLSFLTQACSNSHLLLPL